MRHLKRTPPPPPPLDAIVAEPLDALPVFEPPPPPLDPELVLDALPVPDPWYRAEPHVVAFRLLRGTVVNIFLTMEALVGAIVLTLGLAILAAVPILQFLSLGYLLEAGARVARTGKLREGFIGVRAAAWLGGLVALAYLLLVPVRLVSDFARSAHIIDPGGSTARNWRVGLLVLIAFTFGFVCVLSFVFLHLAAWRVRGQFRFPWRLYSDTRDVVWDTVMGLRLPFYFWLGLRGFVAAFAWLALPVSFMILGHLPSPAAPLLGWMGALMLAAVLIYLPFLQMRMVEQNRLAAAFEILAVRADYRKAPWMYTIALTLTLLSAVPLYLLKIEVVPAEAAWLPSLVFVSFIFPARLLTGWAVACAHHRKKQAHWFFRWTGRLPQVPVALFYVLILFFSQFTSWNGVWSLYEQHTFLLPVPFFGM